MVEEDKDWSSWESDGDLTRSGTGGGARGVGQGEGGSVRPGGSGSEGITGVDTEKCERTWCSETEAEWVTGEEADRDEESGKGEDMEPLMVSGLMAPGSTRQSMEGSGTSCEKLE